jgi:hypothetical protein
MNHRRALGRRPDDETKRCHYLNTRLRKPVKAGEQDDSTIIQPLCFGLDQKDLPSCVGKSYQNALNALLGVEVSGVNLWIEGRAIDGNLERTSYGTTASSAIEVLLENGWTRQTNPHEDDIDGSDVRLSQLPELTALLEGDDNRVSTAIDHETFNGPHDEMHYAILAALREANSKKECVNALVFGTGVSDPYFTAPPDTVLSTHYLSVSGPLGGHEQRIAGWVKERNAYLIANSWGLKWTYCVVNGKKLLGHCLVSRSVVETAWDIDKIRVK